MTRNGMFAVGRLAFLFWAAFLLVLEPGNIAKALMVGRELTLGREAARILCAALIGTAAMPAVLRLVRRYPVQLARSSRRNALWLLLGLVALAGAMNVFSSFVAAWGFQGAMLPAFGDVRRQLVGNWALMSFALAGLALVVRVLSAREVAVLDEQPAQPAARVETKTIVVRTGTRSHRVDMDDVDWIEAQGNYVALHVGARAHLHRRSLTAFEAELDPERFIRIHRGAVVALGRIEQLRSDGEGDATVLLSSGRQLRISKPYRKGVRERWRRS